jgi:3-hydroxyacyl-CoA dehydrogenase
MEIKKVGIRGSGLMGSGIAMVGGSVIKAEARWDLTMAG